MIVNNHWTHQGVAMRASRGGGRGGGRTSREHAAHVTKGSQNRNKMAATGDEAAAMDSISKAPSAHPAALIPAGTSSSQAEAPGDAAESLVLPPKKTSTNSRPCFLVVSVAC